MLSRVMLVLSLVPLPAVALAQAATPVEMKEWTVPWEKSRPRDPHVAGDGRVWFVGQEGNYVAVLDPRSGNFKRYEVDPGTNPHTVMLDAKGMVWYTGNRNGMIGRIDPATGAITRFPLEPRARDPHTLVFDHAGVAWFTVQNGNLVGRLDPATGKSQLIEMPTKGARPYGIVIDSKGRPWFCEFGTNKLATVDPATMQLREYALRDSTAHPRRVAVTSDDRIWYVDYVRGELGRLDPATGKVKTWPAPSGKASLPYGMASDDKDRLWFVETGSQPNRLVGFDPKTEKYFGVTTVGSGGGTIRHMYFDGKTGLLWFGTDNNTIGRAVVSPKTSM